MKSLRFPLDKSSVSGILAVALIGFSFTVSDSSRAQEPETESPESTVTLQGLNIDDETMRKAVEVLIGSAVSLSNRDYPEVEKAIQRFNNHDTEGALAFLKTAKEKYTRLPPPLIMLAKLNVMGRNAQGAYSLLEMQVGKDPSDPEAYLLLADQAFAANRTAEAEALFEKADKLVQEFDSNAKRKRDMQIRVLAGRAAVYERRGKWEQAHDLLQKWVEMDPDNAMSHARLGVTLFRLNKPKDSYNQFTKARELNPNMPHPYASLGQLFTQIDDMDNARKAFEQAYAQDKTDPNTVRTYAEWLLQQGELDKAQEVSGALRKLTPDKPVAVLLDGVVALMKGQNDRAEDAFEKVLSLDPGNARANDLLALMLIESDKESDKQRALRYAELNTKQFPNSAQANITKAYVLYMLGRKSEANEPLQVGMRGQIQSDSAYLIAKLMVAQGQEAKARQALEQMLQNKQGLFIFRNKAEQLLKELNEEG